MKKLLTIGTLLSSLAFFGMTSSVMADIKLPTKKIPHGPVLKLKANLKVADIGWSGEFCNMSNCYKALQQFRINKATCALSVRIMNNGAIAASNFKVRLVYTNGYGNKVVKYKHVALQKAGGFGTSQLIKFNNIGSYKINRPFVVTVDSGKTVPETNEADNTRSRTFNF